MKKSSFGILLFGSTLFLPLVAFAEDVLPYSQRTAPYSGYSTSVSGDIRTVGMSGATIGLGDTFIAAGDNPAGLAMTLKTGDTNVTSNDIHDGYLQNFDNTVQRGSLGLALSILPMGYGLGAATTHKENQAYAYGPGSSTVSNLFLSVHEYRAMVGRSFLSERLAIGLSLNFGVAELSSRSINPANDVEDKQTSTQLGFTAGAVYRLPYRILVGFSYRLPMEFDFEQRTALAAPPGFFQNVKVPGRFAFGLGWIPNRVFRSDLSFHFIQSTPGAALLRDQNAQVGENLTFQPRLGAAYVFADYRNIKGTFFAGSYYETSRISNRSGRFHGTGGVEVKFWMVNVGSGLDLSSSYRNFIASVGIDLIKAMSKLELIPDPQTEEHRGLWPKPFERNVDGLSDGIVDGHKAGGESVDPVKAGLAVPEKIGEKIKKPKSLIDKVISIPGAVTDEIDEIKTIEKKKQTKKKD